MSRTESLFYLLNPPKRRTEQLSGEEISQQEWSEVFQEIVSYWEPPKSTCLKPEEYKTDDFFIFFLWIQRIRHFSVDALQNPWSFTLCSAFPPLHLIPRVLVKFRLDNAKLILVAPYWPKRQWFQCYSLCLTNTHGCCHSGEMSGSFLNCHAKINGLACEEEILRTRGLSNSVINTLLQSQKTYTRTIYGKIW